MRRLPTALLLLLAASGARAEGFSGFYAGINAGYAAGTERDPPSPIGPGAGAAPAPWGPTPGADLPPSAAGAAAAMAKSGVAERRALRR